MLSPATFALFQFVYFLFSSQTVNSALVETLTWSWNDVKMPYPVSDAISTYVKGPNGDEDGFIIITGGCDHKDGNKRGDGGNFYCLSVTTRTLKFDPFGNKFTELPGAPRPRYRHAAVLVGKKVYVIGGRDVDDNIVEHIDVYDTDKNEWDTVGKIPSVTSDLTAWAHNGEIFVAGGYDETYTALNNTYRIKENELVSTFVNTVTTTPSASMTKARGDIHAVEYEGYVYLVGGFSHTNWCAADKHAERYHIMTNTWEELPNLLIGRGDMAVTELLGKIITIGGEAKPEDCETQADPAFQSSPQNHVEVFDPVAKKWLMYASFKDYRMRFAASSVPAQDRIYTFGGQLLYDQDCDCFPSSDEVGIAQETLSEKTDQETQSSSLSGGVIAAIVVSSAVGVLVFAGIIWQCSKSEKMLDTGADIKQNDAEAV